MKACSLFPTALVCLISTSVSYGVVVDPLLSPAPGVSDASFDLTITCSTPGSVIHYTLNGSEPTLYDPTYSGVITINRNWTVKAKAWAGAETSVTVTGNFTMSGSVAAGAAHSVALQSSGAIMAWGLQQYGRLGNNATASANITSPASSRYSSSSVIGDGSLIAAGFDHSVFLEKGGKVWTFGRNDLGQLGINTTTTQSGIAKQVTSNSGGTTWLTGCVSVAAGNGFAAAVFGATGEVYTWGNQATGRLGNGSTVAGARYYAGKVYQGTTGTTPLTGIGRVATGGASGLGLNPTTRKAWAWGDNAAGQLGQGNTTVLSRAAVVKLNSTTDLTDVTDLACGGDHTALVRWKAGDSTLQGRVFCVGNQQYGRLGNNSIATGNLLYANQPVLKAVGVPLENIEQVAAGPGFTLALDASGNVWAWGRNQKGALGTGNTSDSGLAVAVKKPNGTGQLGNIARIAAGGVLTTVAPIEFQTFAVAVANDGTVYAWGYNANGQLGNSTTSTGATNLPVVVGSGFNLLPKAPDVTLASTITQSANPGAVTLTANPTDPDNNITKVEFYNQGNLMGQATAAPWELNLNNLAQGDYHNYAVVTDATGYKGYSTPVFFTITSPLPVVTLDSAVTAGSTPGAVTLTAAPSDPNNAISKVEFYSQGALVGQATSSPWTLGLASLAAGNYKVSAKVTNAVGQVGNSAAAYFTITASPADASLDADGDGLTITQENALGTSDQDSDTDGDGIPDFFDGTPRVVNSLNFTASSLLVTSPLR